MTRVLLGLALLLLVAEAASGHARSTSWSSWWIDGRRARVVLRVPQLELTRLPFGIVAPPRLPPGLGRYAVERVRLLAGGVPCPVVDGPRALQAPPERAVLEWRLACPASGALAIESRFLREPAPGHLHFARVRTGDGPAVERVLSSGSDRFVLPAERAGVAPTGSPLSRYLRLGIEHIATGYDHLVFLFGLLLLAASLREVATIVTGFTVAHSITLALAALGRVRPEPAAVDALIGLSIALVAVENAWLLAGRPEAIRRVTTAALLGLAALAAAGWGAVPALTLAGLGLFAYAYLGLVSRSQRPTRLRAAIAFSFGLVHGIGFAGVLAEAALPRDRLVPALLGFNLGVEVGQLAIVVAVLPLLLDLRRQRAGAHRWLVESATGVVAALGVFWLVVRAYG